MNMDALHAQLIDAQIIINRLKISILKLEEQLQHYAIREPHVSVDQEEYDCDKRAIQQLMMEAEADEASEQVFPKFNKVCKWNEVC